MGNCLRSSEKVLPQSEEREIDGLKEMRRFRQSNSEEKRVFEDGKKKKKMVGFGLTGEGDVDEGELSHVDHVEPDSKPGVVRIKVVVTREELDQILNCNNGIDLKHSTLEELVSAMKLRGRRICEVRTSDNNGGSWRPALESIPEDH